MQELIGSSVNHLTIRKGAINNDYLSKNNDESSLSGSL